jgi:hypothetical protein
MKSSFRIAVAEATDNNMNAIPRLIHQAGLSGNANRRHGCAGRTPATKVITRN